MADMDTATLEAHIAVIKRATEAGRESCEGDWHGKDFAQEQAAYDPSEVDHAIAAILNAVADGELVRADRIEALEAALTAERAGADALAEVVRRLRKGDSYAAHADAALSAHDARRKGGV